MKKLITMIFIFLFSTAAHAGGHVGQCVFPKSNISKSGRLEFKKTILIHSSPKATEGEPLKVMDAFRVRAENGAFIQLEDKDTGSPIGWSKLSDFEFKDLRNCNL